MRIQHCRLQLALFFSQPFVFSFFMVD